MTTLVSRVAEIRETELTRRIVATMNPATMETLQLFRGDTIIVRCVDPPVAQDVYSYVCIVARSGATLS